jgi:hypothetical protein
LELDEGEQTELLSALHYQVRRLKRLGRVGAQPGAIVVCQESAAICERLLDRMSDAQFPEFPGA